MKLQNSTYDKLKDIVTIWLPALAAFYLTLSGIWGFPYGEAVAGTITAVAALLGAILKVSTNNYRADKVQDTYNTEEVEMFDYDEEDYEEYDYEDTEDSAEE